MFLVKLLVFIVIDKWLEMNQYLVFLLSKIEEIKLASVWDQTIEYQQ